MVPASALALLVEDDRMIAENIGEGRTKASYALDWTESGTAAELALATTSYDLVLLDLGLPGKQGIEVLRALRSSGNTVPEMILTAQGKHHCAH